jgi:8-oxo-dGTP pyrophosphatase MutT (NUDIX family)
LGNCTDEELAFFLGVRVGARAGDDDDNDEGVAHHVGRLFNSPLVPASWTLDRGTAALVAAHAVYPQLSSLARDERRRRAGGGACCRDALSMNPLQLPKGVVDPGETPWAAALRELREEAGVEAREVCRAEAAPGITVGPMTAFVVTLGEKRTASGAAGAGCWGGWEVEGSPETVRAVWVPVSRLVPGPQYVQQVRQVKEVLDKVLPRLDEWVPPRIEAETGARAGEGTGAGVGPAGRGLG